MPRVRRTVGSMKRILGLLLRVIDSVEGIEPETDASAYLKRELLEYLDKAQQILRALAADE